ncbi:MAG: DUF4439 domain-containing protein [Solirubrobacteraceae bacterium]
MSDPRRTLASRRAVLAASLGAAAVALEGCSKSGRPFAVRRIPPSAAGADVTILNRALALEQLTIAAYTAAAPLLSRRAQALASRFLGQELAHAGELRALVTQAGGKPHEPQVSYDLGQPRSHQAVLLLLHRLEREQIATYLDAVPNVSPGPVRAGLASILGDDAQHIALLRSELGRAPLLGAFVTGNE